MTQYPIIHSSPAMVVPSMRIIRSLVVSLSMGSLLLAAPVEAANCFTPEEASAAHFRTLQQDFIVAALNCRTIDPSTPTFSSRYNDFVGRFALKLQENATALRRHFQRAGDNVDTWMTRVANHAGQRVITDPQYCQQAWDNLDKALALSVTEVQGFASATMLSHPLVPICEPIKVASTKARGAGTNTPPPSHSARGGD